MAWNHILTNFTEVQLKSTMLYVFKSCDLISLDVCI